MFNPAQWNVQQVSTFEEGMKLVFGGIPASEEDFGTLVSLTPKAVSEKALDLILGFYSDPTKVDVQASVNLHPKKTIEIRLGYHFAWQQQSDGEFMFYTR